MMTDDEEKLIWFRARGDHYKDMAEFFSPAASMLEMWPGDGEPELPSETVGMYLFQAAEIIRRPAPDDRGGAP